MSESVAGRYSSNIKAIYIALFNMQHQYRHYVIWVQMRWIYWCTGRICINLFGLSCVLYMADQMYPKAYKLIEQRQYFRAI